tara:strand:- start:3630 stop:5810 length:2181 start_codon:yes stop_codon:yes gene_type:complete
MAIQLKRSTQFVKGLVTEAGELTFPENASIDELNCDLSRKGNRRRRLGIAYEENYELSSYTPNNADLISTGTWENVGGQASLQYHVVQIGATLYFYNKANFPLSSQIVPVSDVSSTMYSLDLTTYEVAGLGGAASSEVSVTSIDGALIVVSPSINAFYLERNKDTGVFTETLINFRERDFEVIGEFEEYLEGDATPSDNRKYDTANSGWAGTLGDAALTTYLAAKSNEYPPLTHAWFSGKDANGNFAVATWDLVGSGTSSIASGYYKYDVFNTNRSSNVTGATDYAENSRFKTVASFAGRVFYSGLESSKNSSKIYFSKQLDSFSDLGECMQQLDPTSEGAALLDTDGGFIKIPEAHNITRIAVLGTTLVVFAENGVWVISGVDDVFRATSYGVRKVTDIGLINSNSMVDAEGSFLWWSPSGIHSLTTEGVNTIPKETNISISSIQTFWEGITAEERDKCIVEYDYLNKKVFWLYPSVGETQEYKFNKVLILDLVLQAFYPWTISDQTTDTNYVCGMVFFKGVGSGLIANNVVDSNNDQVIDSLGNTVVVSRQGQVNNGNSIIKFMVRDGVTGKITFADFNAVSFLDWGDSNYTSYAEAGYDFMGDMSTFKTAPYINVMQGVTETGWTGDETTGYTRVRPSSLKVSAFWDFKDTASSPAQQAYRLKRVPIVDPNSLDSFSYPHSIISSKLKLRGRGKVVKIRFESEEGYDFNLIGYEMIGDKTNQY